MLAKVIMSHPDIYGYRNNFRARVKYVASKATAVAAMNLAGSWQDAARQMEFTAGLNPHARSAAYHFVLTWAETERPTDQQMMIAAKEAIRELGGAEHQAVLAIHKDRPSHHIHIVLNRIHPISGFCLSVSHDYLKLEKVCRRIEHRMSWPADRGRFDWSIRGNEVRLVPKPMAHWQQKVRDRELGRRRDSDAMQKQARSTGLPSPFLAWPASALTELRKLLRLASNWQAVHRACANLGLKYILHRAGARIRSVDESWFAPASHLGTAFGRHHMEARLGPFEAGPQPVPDDMPDRQETAIRSASWITKLHERIRQQSRQRAAKRHEQQTVYRHLMEAQNRERHEIRTAIGGRRDAAAIALRRVMNETHQSQRRAFRAAQPAPSAAPRDIIAEIERIRPDVMQQRRHAQALRALLGADPGMEPDHTALRQAWCASHLMTKLPDAHQSLRKRLVQYASGIRLDHQERLILAHRNAQGSIIGFSALDISNHDTVSILVSGSRPGLIVFGARSATHCLVTTDIVTAITSALLPRDAPCRYLVPSPDPDLLDARQFSGLANTIQVRAAIRSADVESGMRERLETLLPSAKFMLIDNVAERAEMDSQPDLPSSEPGLA